MVVCPNSSSHDYDMLYSVKYDTEGDYTMCDQLGGASQTPTANACPDLPVPSLSDNYRLFLGLGLLLLTLSFLQAFNHSSR